jgi:hypothetical protein
MCPVFAEDDLLKTRGLGLLAKLDRITTGQS